MEGNRRKRKSSAPVRLSAEKAQQQNWSLHEVDLQIEPLVSENQDPSSIPPEALTKKRKLKRNFVGITSPVGNLPGVDPLVSLGTITLSLDSFSKGPFPSQWEIKIGSEPHSCLLWDSQRNEAVAMASLGLPTKTVESVKYLLQKGFLLLSPSVTSSSLLLLFSFTRRALQDSSEGKDEKEPEEPEEGSLPSVRSKRRDAQRTVVWHFLPFLTPIEPSPLVEELLRLRDQQGPSEFPGPADHSQSLMDEGEAERKIYAAVRRSGKERTLSQPPEILPPLRGYQKRAAGWMIDRESGSSASLPHPLWVVLQPSHGPSFAWLPWTGRLSLSFPRLSHDISGGILADEMGLGKTLEVLTCVVAHPSPSLPIPPSPSERIHCSCGAQDISQRPPVSLEHSDSEEEWESSPKDEEVIWLQCDECLQWEHAACVGVVPKGPYFCQKCALGPSQPLPIRATLLVTPPSITPQWLKEIQRHLTPNSLRVLEYRGVKGGYVSPRELAAYDVILTNYDVLRAELHHVTSGEERYAFRSPKLYRSIPSPLVRVLWWRNDSSQIVIDECQQVENPTAAARLVRELPAIHRWGVSGTVMPKGVGDLGGLLGFLGIDPWGTPKWWNELHKRYLQGWQGAQTELHNFLRRILWRSSKGDVQDELGLPPQHRKVISLQFSPVEKYFYRSQHDAIRAQLSLAISKLQTGPKTPPTSPPRGQRPLSQKEKTSLLQPLLRLRQACCHHQVGAQGIKGKGNGLTAPVSTEELLTQLRLKASIESEEHLRGVVSSWNGIAALAVLEEDLPLALRSYASAWETFESHEGSVRVDPLLRLHIFHNILDVIQLLGKKGEGLTHVEVGTRKVSVGEIISQLKKVREEYLRAASSKVEGMGEVFHRNHGDALRGSKEWESISGKKTWYDQALQVLSEDKSLAQEFFAKFREDVISSTVGVPEKEVQSACRFLKARDVSGLRYITSKHFLRFEELRENALKAVKRSHRPPTDTEVGLFAQCGTCRRSRKGPKCPMCEVEEEIVEYEKVLFFSYATHHPVNLLRAGESLTDKREKSTFDRTSRSSSEAEIFLRSLWNFFKARGYRSDVRELIDDHSEEVKHHLDLFDRWKKEFKAMKELWMALRDQLAAYDEVDMCVSRIRLRLPGEEVPPEEAFFKLQPHDVPFQRIKFHADKEVSLLKLNHSLGQMAYLRNLSARKNSATPCSVCYEPKGAQYVILACGKFLLNEALIAGHDFCDQCILAMIKRSKGHTLKCPSCRNRVNIEEISYVMDSLKEDSSRQEHENNPDDIPVRGSYGTKLEGVVRQLIRIQASEPTAKSLVFSSFGEVLQLLARALEENVIPFVLLKDKKHFQRGIEQFQQDPTIRVLLIPVKSGANGLNLVEATHVLLVEPLLNPGEEAQAIGRVHRIGQERESTVYQFIIKDTIEEKIFEQARNKESHHRGEPHKVKESVSVQEIQELFAGDTLPTIASTPAMPIQEEEEDDEVKQFWSQQVMYNGVPLPRSQVLRQLELIRSWELKSEGKSIVAEPVNEFMKRKIVPLVWERLLKLPTA